MHPNDGRVVSNFIIQVYYRSYASLASPPAGDSHDGIVFVVQALQGKSITIYGEGQQTRSFQYVDDLVDGLMKVSHWRTGCALPPRRSSRRSLNLPFSLSLSQLMNGLYDLPVNLGNPDEYRVSMLTGNED
jgi:hypothetical protein